MNYDDFLHSKVQVAPVSGFEVRPEDINPALKPHQRDAVMWAVKGGRRALFEAFGLGKTVQELEWCRLVQEHEQRPVIIVLPLGVRQEFSRDAQQLLGMDPPVYVRTMAEVKATPANIYMTNYERVRDGDIDPHYFAGAALDEASVLRSYGSKTFQEFMHLFKGVKYKLVATATPSPNRYKELIHYAGYLEVMDTGQALTRFFQRDSTKANNLTLYPRKEEEFWLWVSSWALFLSSPADLGYDATGYDLPPLDVRIHKINTRIGDVVDPDGQVKMMRDAAVSLQDAAKEKNESVAARVAKAKEIVDSDPDAHFLLWHDLEYERKTILKEIPGTVDIYGSMDYDERERRVIDFSEGRTRLFATKKSLSGSGCNFQRYCHRAIFVGIDYEFNDFIQAIHRIYRFLQGEQVIIDVIFTEAEEQIWRVLLEKWDNHNKLQKKMREIVLQYGLLGERQAERMARSIGVSRVEQKGQNWTYVNNDCVEEVKRMADNSVGLIHTSIPFSNHYEYTPSYNDFGHNESTAKFFQQMDYLTPELLRILQPGRVAAIHVKDRVLFGNVTGYGMPSMEPFHAQCMPNKREKLIELLLVEFKVQGFLPPYGTICSIAEDLIANGVTVLPESGIGDMSDGYHTFNELYHHRAVLFSVICNLHPLCSWKAKKHHDGTMYDGMFIVGINTPEGQATYHYDIDPYWDMFRVPEAEFAPTWDGHTPDEAIRRIGLLGVDGVTFATDNNVGSKWIPVTERLPEADAGDVLCITPGGHYKVLQWLETFGCWSDPGGIDFTNFKRGYVTHWMPLPQPPKGE